MSIMDYKKIQEIFDYQSGGNKYSITLEPNDYITIYDYKNKKVIFYDKASFLQQFIQVLRDGEQIYKLQNEIPF